MFDVKICNGLIIDGSGNKRYKADIGIIKDRIVKIGDLSDAKAGEVIEAEGHIICPGFIDIHSHSDLMLIINPLAEEKIRQGVTTEIVGNCGLSLVPGVDRYKDELEGYIGPLLNTKIVEEDIYNSLHSVSDYLGLLEKKGANVNVGALVGHGNLRIAVAGFNNIELNNIRTEQIKERLSQCMDEGALGLSSGLAYIPGSYASRDELVELCKIVSNYNGIYTSHLRNESNELIKSYREAIKIAELSGAHVQISHHKVMGPENYGKTIETIFLITEARARGLKVTCDQYPYDAGSTIAMSLLPPWVFEKGMDSLFGFLQKEEIRERIKAEFKTGLLNWQCVVKDLGWSNILIAGVNSKKNEIFTGKDFVKAAAEVGKEPADFLFDLLIEEKGDVIIVAFNQSAEDIKRVMQFPYTMFGSDGVFCSKPHPRLYGTFPRILGKYVREEGVLTLEEAVRKMTSLPAGVFGLARRGLIKKDYYADITIFDKEEIIDRGTYVEPAKSPAGIKCVLVNGEVVFREGRVYKALSGQVIKNKK